MQGGFPYMQIGEPPVGSVKPTVFGTPLRTMACYRGIVALLLVAATHASNESPSLPIPYAASGYEVESNHLPSDQDAGSSSYYSHQSGAAPSLPEGFQVQSGIEGYVVPALAGAYGLANAKPSIIDSVKPYLYGLVSVLPKVAAAAVGVLGLLLVGTLLTTCVCAYTNVCHMSFLGVKLTGESVRGFMTEDKISEIASFVQKSIKKYQDLSAKTKRSTNAHK